MRNKSIIIIEVRGGVSEATVVKGDVEVVTVDYDSLTEDKEGGRRLIQTLRAIEPDDHEEVLRVIGEIEDEAGFDSVTD